MSFRVAGASSSLEGKAPRAKMRRSAPSGAPEWAQSAKPTSGSPAPNTETAGAGNPRLARAGPPREALRGRSSSAS
eukprot:15124039-Alexandrium_andersonii.AAC.1